MADASTSLPPIDVTNPIGAKVSDAYNFNGSNLDSGITATPVVPVGQTPTSTGLDCTTGTAAFSYINGITQKDYTIMAQVFLTATPDGFICGVNIPDTIADTWLAFTGNDYMHTATDSGATKYGLALGDFNLNDWNNIIVKVSTSGVKECFINGVNQTVLTDDYWGNVANQVAARGAGREFNGVIGSIVAFDEHLSNAEILSLGTDPYQVFESSSSGVTVTPDAVNSSSVSLNPTIEYKSLLQLSPPAINSSSISLDPVIEFSSVLTLSPNTVKSDSIALNPTILFSGSLEINPGVVNSSSVSLNPNIQFSSSLSLTPSVVNTLSVALNPFIEYTSALVIAPQTINSASISIDPLIEFKSVINLTPDTINSLSVANNPLITTGEVQKIGTVTAGFADDLYSVKYKLSGITVNFKE